MEFPLPKLDPLFNPNPTEFQKQWEEAIASRKEALLQAYDAVGIKIEKLDPDFPTRYFLLSHNGRQFSMPYNTLEADRILKLGKKNRMETIHEVATYIEANFSKDLFYNTVQGILNSRPNFRSKSDAALNQWLFSITCDFLREKGFTFHMD